jgi:hypothetical protein
VWWFVAGAVLFNVAIAFAVFAFRAHRRRRVMTDTATVSARDLAALRAGSAGTTAAGSFRHPCEVKGLAQPGRAGLLKSDLSRTECVWHGHVVLRRYRSTSRDSSGRTSTSTDEERVAGHISDAPFAVADQTGGVLIRPEGLEAEETDEVLDSYVPKEHAPAEFAIGDFNIAVPGGLLDNTLGYRYIEWVIRPGRSVYVLGEAADEVGTLTVGKPLTGGRFVVSTRSEAELVASEGSRRRNLALAAAAVGVLGVASVVAGLIY